MVLKKNPNLKLIFIHVAGEDRPGIIASITEMLYQNGCNLEDASMTQLDGKFAMMMAFRSSAEKILQLKKIIAAFEKKEKLSCFLKEFSGSSKLKALFKANCFISVIGPDQTGIVYKISQILAGRRLNITDLNCKVLSGSNKSAALYSLMMETYLPPKYPIKSLEAELQALARKLKVEIQVKPVQVLNF